jgi:hypothetical protein
MREKHFDFYHRDSGKVVRVTLDRGKAFSADEGVHNQLRIGWWSILTLKSHMKELGFREVANDDSN